jgi:hypothetical protein
MHKLACCAVSLGLALAGMVGAVRCGPALAQATGGSQAEQGGTQPPKADAFSNGSLAVPGAPADTETAPSKFSARNAASDLLPTAAFRLKHLNDGQKHEIYRLLTEHRSGLALSPGGGETHATVGAELPASIVLNGHLAMVPETVAARFPALRDTAFMRTDAAVLIVDLRNRQVIGVLRAP